MKHTFRVNIYGKGNSLYSGESLLSYKEYSLDVESDGISKNYLAAQKRLDLVIETQMSRWCLSISQLMGDKNPVIAYGCFLPEKDKFNRSGIGFIHAIESTSDCRPKDIVLAISQMLSPRNASKIRSLIANIALGSSTLEHLTDYMESIYKERKHDNLHKSIRCLNQPIKEIRQDCSGATTLVWLTMIMSHSKSLPPWEIYEEYSNQTETISIFSSSSEAKIEMSLSNYLHAITHNDKLIVRPFSDLHNRSRKFISRNSKKRIVADNQENVLVSVSQQSPNEFTTVKQKKKSFLYKFLRKFSFFAKKILKKVSTANITQVSNIPDVAQAVSHIQRLLNKLSETYNVNYPSGREKIIARAIAEINKNPDLQVCVDRALKKSGSTVLLKAINHPVAAVVIDAFKKS